MIYALSSAKIVRCKLTILIVNLQEAESAESAVKPSVEGFANGACEL